MMRGSRFQFLSGIGVCCGISLLVFGIVVLLRMFGEMQSLELAAYDVSLKILPKEALAKTPQVMIVGINDDDIREFPDLFSSDKPLAELIESLIRAKPAVIGLDIIRDAGAYEDTAALDKAMVDAKAAGVPIVFTYGIMQPASMPKNLDEKDGVATGFCDFPSDPDEVVRRAFAVKADPHGMLRPSLSWKVADAYLRSIPDHRPITPDLLPRFLGNWGGFTNVNDGGWQFMLDFRRPALSTFVNPTFPFDSIRLRDVISSGGPNESLSDSVMAVEGKAVLVGYTAKFTPDQSRTPLENLTFGVTLQADIVDQLIRLSTEGGHPVAVWSKTQEYLWILAFSLAGGLIASFEPPPIVLGFVIAAGLLILATAGLYLLHLGLWVPVVPPAMGFFLSSAIAVLYESARERKHLKYLSDALATQMSPAVAKSLAGAMAYTNGRLQPQRMQMVTVLFTDIKGFSGTSETLDAPLLMQWLNLYLQQMCNCVNSNGGVVIQYIGDSVMAAFGVPFPRENDEQFKNDAVSAVRCAISMRDAVRVLNEQNAATNLPEIVSRIGIFTGPVAAGMLGDARKTQYTIIGDTVNTAARLESFDKSQMQPSIAADGCRILVGGPTRDLLGNEFKLQEIGTTILSGKKTKVAVFAVV